MRILFVGTNVPNEIEYKTKNISAAGNRFQNNLIFVMRQQGITADELAYLAIPLAERCLNELRNNHSDEYEFVAKQEYGDGSAGILKSVRAFHRLLKQHVANVDAIMCYNVNYAWLNLPLFARKHKKKSVLILADYSGPECFQNVKSKFYAWMMRHTIRGFDIVVGLSPKTESILKPGQQFMLMEGGIDEAFYHEFDHPVTNVKPDAGKSEYRVMYSGLLSKVTGVDKLIDVMDQVMDQRNDLRLVISGKGDLESLILEKQRTRPWLDYLGHLQYQQYIDELKKADLLVNPRNMELPENTNNFPSKILDYLASGVPILSTRFSGWEKFEKEIVFFQISEWSAYLANWKPNDRSGEANRTKAKTFIWSTQIKRVFQLIYDKDGMIN